MSRYVEDDEGERDMITFPSSLSTVERTRGRALGMLEEVRRQGCPYTAIIAPRPSQRPGVASVLRRMTTMKSRGQRHLQTPTPPVTRRRGSSNAQGRPEPHM